MILRETLEFMFAAARKDRQQGRMAWDVDDVCRWSYFFIDSDRQRLIQAGLAFERAGYEFVRIFEKEDDEQLYLRVDRIERHTVDSLLARNAELYAFADTYGLADYDGMEVGAVDESIPDSP